MTLQKPVRLKGSFSFISQEQDQWHVEFHKKKTNQIL